MKLWGERARKLALLWNWQNCFRSSGIKIDYEERTFVTNTE